MVSAVRVLPALIAVSIGALAFKGVDLAQAVAQAAETKKVDDKSGPNAPETPLTAGVGDHADAPPAAADGEAPPATSSTVKNEQCMPAIDYTEAGLSAQDVAVLRKLSERRQELDDREKTLDTREQMAAAAEGKLTDQVTNLKALEVQVNKLLAQNDAKRDERMTSVMKTYETMKPSQAAAIFNAMDDQLLLDVSKGMKPATLGPIMAVMDIKRAQSLTKMLAALAAPPAAGDIAKPPAAATPS